MEQQREEDRQRRRPPGDDAPVSQPPAIRRDADAKVREPVRQRPHHHDHARRIGRQAEPVGVEEQQIEGDRLPEEVEGIIARAKADGAQRMRAIDRAGMGRRALHACRAIGYSPPPVRPARRAAAGKGRGARKLRLRLIEHH